MGGLILGILVMVATLDDRQSGMPQPPDGSESGSGLRILAEGPVGQPLSSTVADDRPPGSIAPAAGTPWRSLVRELVETVVLAVVIFLLIRTVVQNFRVDGISMEPNFQDGQFLLINKLTYRLGEPQRGDVVVFRYPRDPSRDFIKRVVGLPGETVEVRSGQVFIDGRLLTSSVDLRPGSYSNGPIKLEADQLYVLGDNRPNSSDSHSWGPLSLDLVIGKVLLSYWPPENWGLIPKAQAEFSSAWTGLGT